MTSPHIARLDRSLAKNGEDIILRRVVGTTNQANTDVTCRAVVRPFKAAELIGGITQTDSKVILSPSEIIRAQWPGGQPVSNIQPQSDPRVPRTSDKVVIQGKVRAISFVKPLLVNGELVRIELTVAG